MRLLLASLARLGATPVAAQDETPAAPDYSQASSWLCLPGRLDACGRPLATTALHANAYGPVRQVMPAAAPPIDCFYVYPTVSRDPGENSDLQAGPEELSVATVQLARFASICRPFAPLYRQATLASLRRSMGGSTVPRSLAPAYADVVAAWRHYLAYHNRGRPFVLIGHSQGTLHLTRLLASEIESGPTASRMVSAILLGFNIEVPEGRVVGGTFQRTPLCMRPGQTGCVITYVSFRASAPPPDNALFGRAGRPGMTVACTHPGRLAGRGEALRSVWYAGPQLTSSPTSVRWSARGEPPSPFLTTTGLVRGECVNQGRLGYLAITPVPDPRDARTDEVPGDVSIAGSILPGWGLHLADMNYAMGDLIRAVELQRDAWRPRLSLRERRRPPR
jgi:pimeloyl-ACP methyl ester carboxylesterase